MAAFALGLLVGGGIGAWFLTMALQTVISDMIDAARSAGADAEKFRDYLRENTSWFHSS